MLFPSLCTPSLSRSTPEQRIGMQPFCTQDCRSPSPRSPLPQLLRQLSAGGLGSFVPSDRRMSSQLGVGSTWCGLFAGPSSGRMTPWAAQDSLQGGVSALLSPTSLGGVAEEMHPIQRYRELMAAIQRQSAASHALPAEQEERERIQQHEEQQQQQGLEQAEEEVRERAASVEPNAEEYTMCKDVFAFMRRRKADKEEHPSHYHRPLSNLKPKLQTQWLWCSQQSMKNLNREEVESLLLAEGRLSARNPPPRHPNPPPPPQPPSSTRSHSRSTPPLPKAGGKRSHRSGPTAQPPPHCASVKVEEDGVEAYNEPQEMEFGRSGAQSKSPGSSVSSSASGVMLDLTLRSQDDEEVQPAVQFTSMRFSASRVPIVLPTES